MTRKEREEAIEEIKRWTPILLNSGQCTEKTSDAQDMAISALKEPTWQEKLEKEYLFESIKEDMTKLQAENERLLKEVETLKSFEEMTNGEVIKALFPNANYVSCKNFMQITSANMVGSTLIWEEWWDAPYQKGGEEE